MSIGHSEQSLACVKILGETLDDLSSNGHLQDAVKTICSDSVDLELLSTFVAITHPDMSMGRYAVLHRHKIATTIDSRDWVGLKQYYNAGLGNLEEVYGNRLLSQQDKDVITRSITTDVSTIMSMIANYRHCKSQGKKMLSCNNSYYGKCKSTVCLAEGIYPVATDVPTDLYVYDRDLHCFNIMDIIELLSRNHSPSVINPQTDREFLSSTLSTLRSKYHKEIAIFTYVLNR